MNTKVKLTLVIERPKNKKYITVNPNEREIIGGVEFLNRNTFQIYIILE